MPKTEMGTGNLRVMLYGQCGVGKSYTILKMVNDNPESIFHIIDVDAGMNEVLAEFPKKDREDMMKRINYYLCDSWNDVMESFEDIRKNAKTNDWLVLEGIGQLWDVCQEHFTREVFGKDLGEYYLHMRQNIAEQKKGGKEGQARLDGWKDWCLPPHAQIMTADGWKFYKDVNIGDLVLTLNKVTKKTNFEPMIDKYVGGEKERTLYKMEGRNHLSISTDGHRWLTTGLPKNPRTLINRRHLSLDDLGELDFRTTENLRSYDRIPIAAPYDGFPSEAKYSDAFVEIMAWFWTEGDFIKKGTDGYSTGHIAQKDKEKVSRIRNALKSQYGSDGKMGHKGKNGLLWNEHIRKDGVTIFTISKKIVTEILKIAPNKVPSYDFIRSLTREQLKLFLDTSVDADGHISNGQKVWNQSNKERVNVFEMACALAGIATATTIRKNDGKSFGFGKNDKYRVTMLKRNVVQPKVRLTKFASKGRVWCPSTPNGTWLAKMGSTPFFTGNSIIKKMHNQDFIEIFTKRLQCKGVILTAATKELDDNPMYESSEVIDIFKKIGYKPEGEKHNIFRVDVILFITRDKNGKRWVKAPKVRGMDEFAEIIPDGQTAWDVYYGKRAERDAKTGGASVSLHPKKVEKKAVDKVADEVF